MEQRKRVLKQTDHLGWLGRQRFFLQSSFAVLAAAEGVADRSLSLHPNSHLSRENEGDGNLCKNWS